MINQLYLRSPCWLQNTLISLYGARNERLQRGGRYRDFAATIAPHTRLSRNELLDDQLRRLRERIDQAVRHVPYYRQLFAQHGISAGTIRSLDDLRLLPLLDKETVRNAPESFIDERLPRRRVRSLYTSGTTGAPLRIYYLPETRQLHYAYYDRFLRLSLEQTNRKATLGGRVLLSAEQKQPPFWRYSVFQKNLLLSSYHLSTDTIPGYVAMLRQHKPDYIEAYPASIYYIARYLQENGLSGQGLTSAIITSSGCLYPPQRELIEQTFGVPVIDQYGSVEMCVFVGQCRAGRYHIHSDYGLLEFLAPDGSPAKAGEEAELVCTGFVNHVMPLIRYRIGDRGVLAEGTCPCGCQFPLLEKIVGRDDDVIYTHEGRAIGRLGSVVYGFPVRETQFVQNQLGALEIHIVRGKGYTTETEEHIRQALQNRLGRETDLDFVYPDRIRRGAGGKLKTIVSNLRPAERQPRS